MSHRIERINNLIRQEISQLLQRQVKDPRLSSFIAVTQVATSPDLKHAKVFVSCIGNDEEKSVLEIVKDILRFMEKDEKTNIEYVEDRFYNDFSYHIDSTKLRKLGWEPKVEWENGLMETINWYLENKGLWTHDDNEYNETGWEKEIVHMALNPHPDQTKTHKLQISFYSKNE